MAETNFTARSALLRLSRKHSGKWENIYHEIRTREGYGILDEQDPTSKELLGWTPITILDPEYPEHLRAAVKPPFVIYCKGDLSLLTAKSLLYTCENRPSDSQHPAVDNLIWDIAKEGIVPIVCWRSFTKGGGQLATVLEAHETTKKPLIVFFPTSAKDPDELGDRIADFGGLAIRESFPGSLRELRIEEHRIAATLCSACLVLGGAKGDSSLIQLSYALNDGKDAGAVAYAMGDPDGYLPRMVIKQGAFLVDSLEDVKELLTGKLCFPQPKASDQIADKESGHEN